MGVLQAEGRDVAATLLDVTYVLQLEPRMHLEYVSDAVAGFTGYTATEYLDDAGLWLRVLDPRDRPVLLSAFNAAIGVSTHATLRWVARDGKVVWTEHIARKVQREDGSIALHGALNHIGPRQIAEARAGIDGRYQMLAEDASDVVFQTDLQGRIVWVSDSIEAVAGWAPAALIGSFARDLIDPSDARRVESIDPNVHAGQSQKSVVLRIRTADGGCRFISAAARPARDGNDEVSGAIVGWRDVDDVVRARMEAESEREILRATLDAQLDPQVLVAAVRDVDGRIVDFRFVAANPAACESLDKERQQVIGGALSTVDPGIFDSEVTPPLKAVVDSGVPLVLNNHSHTYSSGRIGHYDVRAVPVHDGLAVTWRDVTQRFDEAAALADSEARYRLLLEESSDMVTFHDPDGTVQWVSPAIERLLGWSAEERTGRLLNLIHPDDVAGVLAAREVLLAGQEYAATRFRMRTKNRGYRWVESSARAVRDSAGAVRSLVVVTHDIQAQMDSERALADSEERYRLLAENATDVVYRTTLEGVTEWISEGVERVLGFRPDEFIGRNGRDLVAPQDREFVDSATQEVLAGTRNSARFRMPTKDGGQRWVEATIHPVAGPDGQPIAFVGGWRDVQAEVESEVALDRRARTDDLTGLVNRREALAQISDWLAQSNARRAELAVAFCDIDEFKGVNDSLGHAMGDRLLQLVAERIRACVRSGDTVARVGGDEILLILRGVQDLDAATAVAEKVRRAVAEPLLIDGQQASATVSIGVAMVEARDDVDALVARADRAMYLAKDAGRDQVVPLD